MGGRGQKLPQHQRDQLALALGQGLQARAAQVIGHLGGQRLFVGRGREVLHDGDAGGVGHVLLHLPTQCAAAQRREPLAQGTVGMLAARAKELAAETVDVAEHALVDHAHQAIELQQRVLQRRGGQQHLGVDMLQRIPQGAGDDVAGLVDIAQAVRFIHHHQVPADALQVVGPGFGERVGADDRPRVVLERLRIARLARGVVTARFQDQTLQVELVLQLLVPLLAQVGRNDDEDAPLALGPVLGDDQARFDGLPQTHFVGQDDAPRQRIAAGEQGRFHLVRVEVDGGIEQRGPHRLDAVRSGAPAQLPSDVLALMGRKRLIDHVLRSPDHPFPCAGPAVPTSSQDMISAIAMYSSVIGDDDPLGVTVDAARDRRSRG